MSHTCPRRFEGGQRTQGNPDDYSPRPTMGGTKSACSYCGSMPPDDFMQAVRDHVEIGPTDKGYKFYVGDHEGKFYTQHLSEEQGWEFDRLWKDRAINFGYPGHPYVPLFIPGPSTRP